MPLCTEVDNVLGLIDKVQSRVSVGRGQDVNFDGRLLSQVNNDINTLLSVLKNPVFRRICKIQDTVNELGNTLARHPSVTSNDFDITPEGNLILKVTPPVERFRPSFDSTPLPPIPSSKSSHSSKNLEEVAPTTPITTPNYAQEFEHVMQKASQGRILHSIRLFKTEGSSLGFSVVGLKSQEKGELGIFVQEIQPNGIAARDGSLRVSDQILAIDGQPLDTAITHQQAIGILQQTRGEVEIVVARAPDTSFPVQSFSSGELSGAGQLPPKAGGEICPSSPPSEDSKAAEMVLNTEWAEVEVVQLINDGTGLGFGIIGGRSTGVVVKTILPGGVADRCGRLQSGDHILQIGDVNLVGMGSEQVAAVLRQCGNCVRLVVARPVEPSSPDLINSPVPIVPTKILGDPEELERHLMQANGYGNHMQEGSFDTAQMRFHGMVNDGSRTTSATFDTLPEVEIVDVELKKDSHGLGITIAGYVCEKEELSGIFIKSISEGSAADVSGKIAINDRIVEVDGLSLQGFTNHQAVEVLRKTGHMVSLKLERYHHGSKYDQLQSAISHSEHKPPTPSSVSALSLPQVPVDSDGDSEDILESALYENENEEQAVEARNADMDLEDLEMLIDTRYEGEILTTVEAAIMAKWSKIMGPDCDIVVAQLSKAKNGGGLGISLEGTVDVEDGREVRPHHYIRSILPDGPVGRSQRLLSGDELLEVNGRRLLGLNHVEVVGILKDLPMHVRIVCARRPGQPPPSRPIDTSQDKSAFAARNILGGSLQNLFQGSDRMVKAKSDGSLASTGTTGATDTSLSKIKSRSLEPLSGLAMWSSEPHIIELPKGDRGLGFSILDYQDPMNPSETVIVIRSLVPGGVAQQDQRLIPGDRLLAVNDINLENASLDQAVQALKGAPKGVVRIVVAKPLPLPDTSTVSPTQSFEETPPPPLPVSPAPEQLGMKFEKDIVEQQDLEQIQINSRIPPVATERLITTKRNEPPPVSMTHVSAECTLPPALERTIKIQKSEEALGINVEVVDSGVNGLLVTDLASTGAIPTDGRIRIGDYLVALNNESLRNISNAQARVILTRAQQSPKGLSISYIPSVDAEVHKETFLIQQSLVEKENITESNNIGRSTSRTPADGEEAEEIPALPSKTGADGSKSEKSSESTSISSTPASKISQLKQNETSTLYINTGRGNSAVVSRSEAQVPQIQKRVVTHVTIFPSPPPDVIQATASKTSKVVMQPTQQGTVLIRDDSVDDDSSRKDSSGKGQESSSSVSASAKTSGGEDGALLLAKHWGPERLVELHKEPNKSLGISIVGGKVDLYNSGNEGGSTSAISGIFIKNVLPNSPAGRTGQLKTGDRILAVDSIDLRSASHERAVEVIRAAGNPVKFLVQSLVQWSESIGISTEDSETSKSEDTDTKSVTKSQSQAQYSGSQSQSTTSTSQTKSGTETSSTSTSCTSKTQTKNDGGSSSSSSSSSTESEKVTQKRDGASVEESEENEEFEDDPFLRAEEEIKKSPVPKSPSQSSSPPPPPLVEPAGIGTEHVKDEPGMEVKPPDIQTFEIKAESGSSEQHSSEEADELGSDQPLQGRTRTKAGVEIDRASAGNARLSKDARSDELEDEFGYTIAKIEKKWGELTKTTDEDGLPGKIVVEDLERGPYGLGISLAGHKNRLKMAVFIVGINPEGLAYKTKTLQVGDEILEVNGNVLHGRSHLNASALIKSLPHNHVKIIALRKSNAMEDLSVKPIVQFPVQFPLDQEKPEDKYSLSRFPGLRLVTLKKTDGGFGIMIMEGKHAELGRGIFVSDIQPSSVADQAGLLVGDLILSVNQEDLLGCDYDHAAAILKKTEGSVSLVVCNASKTPEKGDEKPLDIKRPDDGRMDKPKLPPKPSKIPSPSKLTSILSTLRKSPTESLPSSNVTSSAFSGQNTLPAVVVKPATPSPKMLPVTAPLSISPATSVSKMNISPRSNEAGGDPATCEIQPGKETTIEINKDRGLGISILGGQDTLLGSIIIQEVYPDGAAFKDGRLKPGDQLLFVNNEDFQNITHSCALAALRQTPNRIKMVVFRDDVAAKEDDLYDILEVELVKKQGKGLGLSIVSRKNGSGVFISDVVPGGQAEADGRLIKGDRILEVNGKDLKESSQEEAASVLKTTMGTINMKIGRFKTSASKRLSSSSSTPLPYSSEISDVTTTLIDPVDDDDDLMPSSEEFTINNGKNSVNISSGGGSSPQLRTVILERGSDGLGFSIVGGYSSPHGNLPIYVKTVFGFGAASNKLKRGDQIVAVDKFKLEGLTHQEVVTILKQTGETVTLSVLS